jgi:myo-inositol-1(or 4)-monophosphatase
MIDDPILAVAVRAARRAGSIVVDAARDLKRLAGHATGHAEIAATARTDAEKAIVTTLRAAFPAHALLGETFANVPASGPDDDPADYRWIVDPVDGMANFVRGFPHYAVSVALAHGRELTHAVVHDPVHDELFTAIRGRGAQLNGVPIRVSACTALEAALVGTVFPAPASARMPAYLGAFCALLPRCAGVRRPGACALDLAFLGAGRLDGFWAMGVETRHIAAGALIVQEAGGRVGDFAGGPNFLNAGDLIAAGGIFNPLRETIAAALPSP